VVNHVIGLQNLENERKIEVGILQNKKTTFFTEKECGFLT
jgi:hypothetical protein